MINHRIMIIRLWYSFCPPPPSPLPPPQPVQMGSRLYCPPPPHSHPLNQSKWGQDSIAPQPVQMGSRCYAPPPHQSKWGQKSKFYCPPPPPPPHAPRLSDDLILIPQTIVPLILRYIDRLTYMNITVYNQSDIKPWWKDHTFSIYTSTPVHPKYTAVLLHKTTPYERPPNL